ncbi:MAG TPA: nuclear transport factor 2 family protein [Ktedonosporobacter sp.]|nr:nuclear transport factor 2 family protein [Ktedonosporobacter sp.]
MAATHEDLESIPQLFYQAVREVMLNINVAPMLALWSKQNDVTYCDPNGHTHQGRDELVAYWQKAAQLNSDGPGNVEVQAKLIMMQRSEGMICTVMAEQIRVRHNAQTLRLKAVATNVYRYEGQHWRMIHRHSGSPTEEK